MAWHTGYEISPLLPGRDAIKHKLRCAAHVRKGGAATFAFEGISGGIGQSSTQFLWPLRKLEL